MKVGFDFNTGKLITDEPKEVNTIEAEYLCRIAKALNLTECSIDKNCDDYTTLSYKQRDLVRVHIGSNTKWIRLFIHPKIKKDIIDDEIFINQKNKNQLLWQINFDDNIDNYKDYLLKSIVEIDKQ